jgi:hypothetical protein
VIREVNYEVARILGLERLVEPVRTLALTLARREAIVGEEREKG